MKSGMHWYSAKLRHVCLLEDHGVLRFQESIVMMRANSFDAAFERSLSIGRKHDDDYTNEDGERVRWRFLEVITLDVIAEDDLDGVEIYSEPQPDDGNSNLRFETEFSPETSRPTQTI